MRALLVWTLFVAAPLAAQERPPAAEQLREKLAAPFLQKASWTLDHAAALARAKQREQLVFGYFTTAGP